MLRLCEIENAELKNSLRYVEIQLAKTKESKRDLTEKYEAAQAEIEKCHENISRSANINHAQAKQIEDMATQLDGVASSQKEANEKIKLQMQQYVNEIDIREMEINRLKKTVEKQDQDQEHLQTQYTMSEDRLKDIEEELELKAGENNRLRKQCCDLEKAIQDLYCSRKGQGSLQIELDSLKLDNERLLALLKETTEYCDFTEDQIFNAAMQQSLKPINDTSSVSAISKKSKKKEVAQGGPKDNDWIPTEAVRAIL